MNIAMPAFFWLVHGITFFFFYGITFNLFSCLCLKQASCQLHIVRVCSFSLIQFENLCLFIRLSRRLIFNVITDKFRFKTSYHVVTCFPFLPPVLWSPFLFSAFSGIKWFLKFSFYLLSWLVSYNSLCSVTVVIILGFTARIFNLSLTILVC